MSICDRILRAPFIAWQVPDRSDAAFACKNVAIACCIRSCVCVCCSCWQTIMRGGTRRLSPTISCNCDYLLYAAPVAPPQVMQIYGVETRSALRLSRPHDLKLFCFIKFMLVDIF